MSRKPRPQDPRALDLRALCAEGAYLEGHWPAGGFVRLRDSIAAWPADGAAVTWAVQGRQRAVAGGEPELWLHLRLQADVVLQCQRCLQPMPQAVAVDRSLRFVRGEDEAARLDEELDDDVLALPGRLDLLELAEDELILALPLVPMHGSCPQPLAAVAPPPDTASGAADADRGGRPNPFASLAGLRGRRDDDAA